MFVFIDIWFVKQEWLKNKDSVFYGESENEQKKDKIFMEGEGDKVKSKQSSKRDRTLQQTGSCKICLK